MAAAAASRRVVSAGLAPACPWWPLVLPLLLLLPLPRPALGNEGGAAGSCECERRKIKPRIVRHFPDRLVDWEYCKDLVRFAFPQKSVCGLAIAPWVIQFKTLQAKKERARACKGCHQPTASSRAPLAPSPSGSPAREVLRETAEPQRVPGLPAASAQETTSGATQPQKGAFAGLGPGQGPHEAVPPQGSWVAVLCLLSVTLFLVAMIVSLVCWRKLPGSSRVTRVPLNDPGTDPEET